MTRIFATSVLLVSALALSGCGTSAPKGFICPAGAALVDAASLTMLPAGSNDPSRAIYKVDITKAGTNCDFDPDTNRIIARVGIELTATRPAAGDAVQYTVPYFIGVSQEGSMIVDKKLYNVRFAFAAGERSTSFSDRVGSFIIVPAADKKSTDYELLIGLQLTKEQLEFNRRVGRFPQ